MPERFPLRPLYNEAGIRALEAAAIAGTPTSGLQLMIDAGGACWRVAQERWPYMKRITVVCGPGNNGGDGFVCARLAHAAGFDVRVVDVAGSTAYGPDAKHCLDALVAAGITPIRDLEAIDDTDLIVDAVFGIGVSRPVGEPFATALNAINGAAAPVLSVDVPSGLDANTGVRWAVAVEATATVTFIAAKQGLYTGDGPDHCGEIHVETLGLPDAVYREVKPSSRLLDVDDERAAFGPRRRTSHKGDNGHALIIGGAPGFIGAALLAGEACARAGAGLVSLALHPDVACNVNLRRPEMMLHGIDNGTALRPLLNRATVVAIGPGLGQSTWAVDLFSTVLQSHGPLVVDADALNLLAVEPARSDRWVLTPHPGEASRLLECTTADIHADRFAAAARLQQRFGGVVILKGAGSVIDDGHLPAIVAAGNPGMGSGGMGDVLTGIVAGIIAQGRAPAEAARLGACVHAVAADRAAADGERGMLAGDLMPHIRALVN